MSLYSIINQDNDIIYIYAQNMGDAENKYYTAVSDRDSINKEEIDEPQSINFVCDDNNLIIENNFLK